MLFRQEQADCAALLEGVKMTQTILNNCLSNFSIEPFDAVSIRDSLNDLSDVSLLFQIGQQFNPKLHEALFEMSSPDKVRTK